MAPRSSVTQSYSQFMLFLFVFDMGSHCIAQAGLKLIKVRLPQLGLQMYIPTPGPLFYFLHYFFSILCVHVCAP